MAHKVPCKLKLSVRRLNLSALDTLLAPCNPWSVLQVVEEFSQSLQSLLMLIAIRLTVAVRPQELSAIAEFWQLVRPCILITPRRPEVVAKQNGGQKKTVPTFVGRHALGDDPSQVQLLDSLGILVRHA